MPPTRTKNMGGHQWTVFELHTMLCLIAKGVHLEERVKKSDVPGFARLNAYENFATQLNLALHGKNYSEDIKKREIISMLDQVLVERKHVVGKGGLCERILTGRITKSMRMAFLREPSRDFDGSMSEWKNGRYQKVMVPYLAKMGKRVPVETTAENTVAVAAAAISSTQVDLLSSSPLSITPPLANSSNIPAIQHPFSNIPAVHAKPQSNKKSDWADPLQLHDARSGLPTAKIFRPDNMFEAAPSSRRAGSYDRPRHARTYDENNYPYSEVSCGPGLANASSSQSDGGTLAYSSRRQNSDSFHSDGYSKAITAGAMRSALAGMDMHDREEGEI